MKAYVTRFTFPATVEALERMVDNNGGEWTTDLEWILAGNDVEWSLPKSVFANDVVFFQYTRGSPANLRACRAEAEEFDDGLVLSYLKRIEPMVRALAGNIVAAGMVEGVANYDEGDDTAHFKQRLFAPVRRVTDFSHPIRVVTPSPFTRLPEFMSGGPLANRAFVSDANYQMVLSALTAAGNTLPPFLRGTHINPVMGGLPLNETTWIEYVRQPDAGFFLEAHLRLNFANYLLRAIADPGQVFEEVLVHQGASSVGNVDNVIRVGGVQLPVEIKLNIPSEADFPSQIRKYTRATELTADNRRLGAVPHSIVAAIDQRGFYLLRDAAYLGCTPDRPFLARVDITTESVARLRAAIGECLVAGMATQ